MSKSGFTFTNLQTGETWTFPDEEALAAFIATRRPLTTLAGDAAPQERTEEGGWPVPAPLPEDYWETAE